MPLCDGTVDDLDTWTLEMISWTMRAQHEKIKAEQEKAKFFGGK
jgi:hypothetical protein